MNIGDIAQYTRWSLNYDPDAPPVKETRVSAVVLQVFHDTSGVEKALVYSHPGNLEVLDTSELEAIEDDPR